MQKIVLETDRLILRNFEMSDIDDYYEYASLPNVGPMAGWDAYTDYDKAVKRMEYQVGKPFLFALVLKEQNKVIGTIELMDVHKERFENLEIKDGAKEIGFVLSSKYWGRGIMPEACKKLMEYAFEKLSTPEIFIGHAEANTQSGRVQEKLGFEVIGRMPNYRIWLDGKNTDFIQRKLTKEQWETRGEKQ